MRFKIFISGLVFILMFSSAASDTSYIPIQKWDSPYISFININGENEDSNIEFRSRGGFGDYDGDGYKSILGEKGLIDKYGVNDEHLRINRYSFYSMGDIDYDNLSELVYVSSTNDLNYMEKEESLTGGLDAELEEKDDFGGIADYDQDGLDEIAYRTPKKKLAFVGINDSLKKTGMKVGEIGGSGDIDNDAYPEVAVNRFKEESGQVSDLNLTFVDYNGETSDYNLSFFPAHIGSISDFDEDNRNELSYINYDDFTSRNPTLRIYDPGEGVHDTEIRASKISIEAVEVRNTSELPKLKINKSSQKTQNETDQEKDLSMSQQKAENQGNNSSRPKTNTGQKTKLEAFQTDLKSKITYKLIIGIVIFCVVLFIFFTSYIPEEGDFS